MITTKNENKYVSCKPGGSYSAVLSFWVIPPVYQVIFSQINVLYFLSLSCSFLWFRHVWVTSFVLGYNFPLVQEIPCTLSMWKYLPVFLNSNYRCNTKGLSRTQSPWLSQIPFSGSGWTYAREAWDPWRCSVGSDWGRLVEDALGLLQK